MKSTLKLMKSLSDEIRLRIINLLFYTDLYVCEIVDILNLPQSTVSRHLSVMKNADIIVDTKVGSWVKYSIVNNNFYKNMVKDIVKESLIYDSKCIEDVNKLKERMKHSRGCEDGCKGGK